MAVEKYATFASTYNQRLLEDLQYISPKAVARIFRDLFPHERDILEIGCGTGLFGLALKAEGIQDVQLTGADISPQMLQQVVPGTYRELHCSDCTRALPAGLFEGALSIGVSEYIVDLAAWFGQVIRVLRPGARWVFTYVENEGDTVEKINGTALLLSHPSSTVERELISVGFGWEFTLDISAYSHCGNRITHRLAVARKPEEE